MKLKLFVCFTPSTVIIIDLCALRILGNANTDEKGKSCHVTKASAGDWEPGAWRASKAATHSAAAGSLERSTTSSTPTAAPAR